MDIVITGRRTEVTDRFRRLAEEKLAKVSQFTPSAYRIDVELSHERNPRQASHCERVEITVRDKGPVVRAEACAEDPMASLDIAFGKLLERLRRLGDRKKVHHGRHAPVSVRGSSLLTASAPAARSGSAGSVAATAVVELPLDGEHSHAQGHRHDDVSLSGSLIAQPPDVDEFTELVARADLPEGAEDLADSPVVIRTKDHSATPMTIEQALYEMELVGHDFYLFVDAVCGKPSVVYRRRGWNYGVIRLELGQTELAGQS